MFGVCLLLSQSHSSHELTVLWPGRRSSIMSRTKLAAAKKQSWQFADPDLAQNLYPHLVVDPNHWNSQIVLSNCNSCQQRYTSKNGAKQGVHGCALAESSASL
jgi:hypothetical protein